MFEPYDRSEEYRIALERIMDKCSPAAMVEMLAVVAEQKAEHLRVNWQEEEWAKMWERVARSLEKEAARLEKIGNPYE